MELNENEISNEFKMGEAGVSSPIADTFLTFSLKLNGLMPQNSSFGNYFWAQCPAFPKYI